MIKDINKAPFLLASDLGASRENIFFRNGKQVKNPPPDRDNEIFCSIRMQNGERASLWMHRTKKLNAIFNTLFQDNRFNQHIEFIEWDDRINCVCGDGIYISSANFFMTKEEFEKFRNSIVPYDEVCVGVCGYHEKPKQVQYPCRGCVYYAACGSSMRTVPCDGRKTKSELRKEM